MASIMRTPFEMTGPCTVYSMDIDISTFIPTDLPFCSVPYMTAATFVPREPEIVMPDLVIPDICHCFSMEVTGDINISDITGALVRFGMTNLSDDCCEQEIELDLQIDMPCLPFDFRATGQVELADDFRFNAEVERKATPTGNCEFSMVVSIDVPCLPLEVNGAGEIGVGDFTVDVDFTRVVGAGEECRLSLYVDIKIPAFGSCGEISIDVDQITQETTGLTGDFTAWISKSDACAWELNFSINFPKPGGISCGDISLDVAPIEKSTDGATGEFSAWITKPTGCEWEFNYSINFPMFSCGELSLDVAPVTKTTDGATGGFSAWITKPTGCEWEFNYSVNFPMFSCGDIDIDVTPGNNSTTGASGDLTMWITKPTGCEWDINFSVNFPAAAGISCGDIDIGANPGANSTTGSEGGLTMWVTNPTGCDWDINFSVNFPAAAGISCGDINIGIGAVSVGGDGLFTPTVSKPSGCEWDLNFKISFPGGGFSCGDMTAGTFISIAPVGSFCEVDHLCPGPDDLHFDRLLSGVMVSTPGGQVLKLYKGSVEFEFACGHGLAVNEPDPAVIDITLPFFSCGDLTVRNLITKNPDGCTIQHACDDLLSDDYQLHNPMDLNYVPGVQELRMSYNDISYYVTCGHIEDRITVAKSWAVTMPFITCGDLSGGGTSNQYITVADCGVEHKCGVHGPPNPQGLQPVMKVINGRYEGSSNRLEFSYDFWENHYSCGHLTNVNYPFGVVTRVSFFIALPDWLTGPLDCADMPDCALDCDKVDACVIDACSSIHDNCGFIQWGDLGVSFDLCVVDCGGTTHYMEWRNGILKQPS